MKNLKGIEVFDGINDEFIASAENIERTRVKKPLRWAIPAALAAAAAIAIMLFGGRGKPNDPIRQANATTDPVAAVETTPEPTAPPEDDICSPDPAKRGSTVRLLSAASNAREWEKLKTQPEIVEELKKYSWSGYLTFDDWNPPTPEEILLAENTCIFRGTVQKVENYRITVGDIGKTTNYDEAGNPVEVNNHSFYGEVDFCIVTFIVGECYRGSLIPGRQVKVFVDNGIYPVEEFEPPIGTSGSGALYYTQLAPNTEVIAAVKENKPNEEATYAWQTEADGGDYLYYRLPYIDYAGCRLGSGLGRGFGELFFERDGEFFYDMDVYDETMLGESPSMDSAEGFIKSLLAGMGL